jgi:hypothetical protein
MAKVSAGDYHSLLLDFNGNIYSVTKILIYIVWIKYSKNLNKIEW